MSNLRILFSKSNKIMRIERIRFFAAFSLFTLLFVNLGRETFFDVEVSERYSHERSNFECLLKMTNE